MKMVDLSNNTIWNEVDASNSSTGTQPGFPEGMLPSIVNDAARALMGAVKRYYDRNNPTVTSAGTANVQTLSYSVAPASYTVGDVFRFIVGTSLTNTGPTTLNVNSLGAVSILDNGSALAGGEMIEGQVAVVAYDSTTNFQLLNSKNRIVGDLNVTGDLNVGGNITDAGALSAASVTAGTGTFGSATITDLTATNLTATNATITSFAGTSMSIRGAVVLSSGAFTIPATSLKCSLMAGGGGGGGTNSGVDIGNGGGAAGAGIVWLSGLTVGNTLTVEVGSGGSGGGTGTGGGGNGGDTIVASGTETISTATAFGGFGGAAPGLANTGFGGNATGVDIPITGNGGGNNIGGQSALLAPYGDGGSISLNTAVINGVTIDDNDGVQGFAIFEWVGG